LLNKYIIIFPRFAPAHYASPRAQSLRRRIGELQKKNFAETERTDVNRGENGQNISPQPHCDGKMLCGCIRPLPLPEEKKSRGILSFCSFSCILLSKKELKFGERVTLKNKGSRKGHSILFFVDRYKRR
jgi:hypothetical protein